MADEPDELDTLVVLECVEVECALLLARLELERFDQRAAEVERLNDWLVAAIDTLRVDGVSAELRTAAIARLVEVRGRAIHRILGLGSQND